MPKKLSSAVAGTLAVGLTLPAAVAAANAADAPITDDLPQPLTGSGQAAPAPALAAGVHISTGRSAGTVAAPLADQSYTFSTGKGPRCMSMQGAFANHQGQDLVTAEGTPITAISDGTVVRTVDGTASRAGFIVVRHNIGGQVYHSGYLHVWDAESHVSVGDSVSVGDTVGLVGESGPTVTPHLHLEVWKGGWHTGTAMDPAAWLAERGVDLQHTAQSVQQREVPSSCDYYAAEPTALLSSASPTADVLGQLRRGAELTSAPGDAADGFVRVTAEGETGWVRHGHLTPDRPAGTSADSSAFVPAASGSAAASNRSEGQHRVTEPLYARSGPGTNYDIRQGMPTGELITVTAVSGDWVQFTRRGEQVWSHGAYVERAGDAESSSQDSSNTGADTAEPTAGSGTHRVTEPLYTRSGPGNDHGVIGGMPTGERVSVVSSDGDWVQIRRANGQLGWSHGAYLTDGDSPTSSPAESSSPSAGTQDSDSAGSDGPASDSRNPDSPDSDSQGPNSSGPDTSGPESSETPSADSGTTGSDSDGSAASGSERSGSGEADSSTGAESSAPAQTGSSTAASHTVEDVYLNARSGAGTSHAVVTVLNPGTGVEVTGRSGAWASFDSAGTTLWVHADHLRGTEEGAQESPDPAEQDDAPEPSAPADSSTGASESDSDAANTTQWVNMRTGAGLDHSVQRTVAPHTELDLLARSGGWYQLRTGESIGWIWKEYLDVPESAEPSGSSDESDESDGSASSETSDSTAESGSSSASDSSSSSETTSSDSDASSDSGSSTSSGSSGDSGSSTDSGSSGDSGASSSSSSQSSSETSPSSSAWSAHVTSGVNMRSGAGLDHDVAQTVPAGARADVLDEQGGWYQVRTDGSTGWIWHEFLDVSGGAKGSSGDTSEADDAGSGDSGSSISDSSSSSSGSSSSGSSAASSGSGSSGSSSSGSSSGRTGPSSGQHAQSAHGPYSAAWDRLAQCESGGNWSINTGNGYYGGVQFSAQSWQWAGGSGLPSDASKQEQIERAHALWERQGWNAWPACSSQLGLTGDPGGWGDSYFDVHGGTQSASAFAAAGQWTAGYSVPLREEPSSDSEKLVQIPRGAVLDAGERSGSWLQVEFTHDGEPLTGWVSTRFITLA